MPHPRAQGRAVFRPRLLVPVASAAVALASAPASAQCAYRTLTGNALGLGDSFGRSVALDGASGSFWAAIGVPGDDVGATLNVGSVQVHRFSGGSWAFNTRIADLTPEFNGAFGGAVDIDYPYLIIGAAGAAAQDGEARVFEHNGSAWLPAGTISPLSAGAGAQVGASVAISGGWGIVGCPTLDSQDSQSNPVPDCGAVVMIRRDAATGAWSPAAMFISLGADAQLGRSVDIAGPFAVAGRPYATFVNGPVGAGSVSVWLQGPNSWTGHQSLYSPDWREGDNVGYSVATNGTLIVAGAPGDDAAADELPPGAGAKANCGSVLIYRWSNTTSRFEFEARIFASNPTDGARFGSSVAVDGDTVIVGTETARQAYVFRRRPMTMGGGWVEVARHTDAATGASQSFGYDVAAAGGEVLLGDPGRDTVAVDSGGVSSFATPGLMEPADNCTSATPIEPGTWYGCSSFASTDGYTACGNGGLGQGPDMWFSYTPRCSGQVVIDTAGSALDTGLSVHDDCPTIDRYHLVSCSDNAPGMGSASRVTFPGMAGVCYLIRVAGVSQTRGAFQVTVSSPAAPSNDTCLFSMPVTLGSTMFSNCSAGIQGGTLEDLCLPASLNLVSDVWFHFAAIQTGTLSVDTCGSSFDTVLAVYDASQCPSVANQALACNDDDTSDSCPGSPLSSRLTIDVAAGQALFIRVAGDSGNTGGPGTGDGVLNLSLNFPACPCDFNTSGALSVQDLFDFLAGYFAGDAAADFNHAGGITVQDIFDFLACWFAGC